MTERVSLQQQDKEQLLASLRKAQEELGALMMRLEESSAAVAAKDQLLVSPHRSPSNPEP